MSEVDKDTRLRSRLKKILALAERGAPGERETAESMLANLLAKHGMTVADLKDDEAQSWHEFEYSGEFERRLLAQIVRMVKQDSELFCRVAPRVRTKVYYEVTTAEKLEIQLTFSVMNAALKAEQEVFFKAFVHKNRLFGPKSAEDADDEPQAPQTPEDLAELKRMSAMMQYINPVQVHKALEK